jgi:dihydroxy-acid dehydratase
MTTATLNSTNSPTTGAKLNRYSSRITQPASQGASQAMLIATGLSWSDLDKPQVGIGAVWYDGNPCNMHLADLGNHVKRGVEQAQMVAMRFNTVGVSDGISMGTDGMSFSLQSRDLIADSIETIMGAQWYDALVALPGCDKNMPGTVMAMGRLNRPSIMVYGGTIRAGCAKVRGTEEKLDVVSAFQAYGQSLAGRINEAERKEILGKSCLVRTGRRAGEDRRMRPRRRGHPQPARARPQTARHRHPPVVHQRHAADHRPRRLDQRRAALDRHGAVVRHRPDD